MSIILDNLEQLAMAATPGPWAWDDKEDEIVSTAPSLKDTFKETIVSGGSVGYENAQLSIDEADAQFIAALSPDVVLRMIAVCKAAKALVRSSVIDALDYERLLVDAIAALEGP